MEGLFEAGPLLLTLVAATGGEPPMEAPDASLVEVGPTVELSEAGPLLLPPAPLAAGPLAAGPLAAASDELLESVACEPLALMETQPKDTGGLFTHLQGESCIFFPFV